MLNDFNKSNPFVIIMRNQYDFLNQESISITKLMIQIVIITHAISIFPILIKNTWYGYIPFMISMAFCLKNSMLLHHAIKNDEKKRINYIIYSKEYSTMNINNEEIMNIIKNLNIVIGKITLVKESIIADMILILILTSILILISCI